MRELGRSLINIVGNIRVLCSHLPGQETKFIFGKFAGFPLVKPIIGLGLGLGLG